MIYSKYLLSAWIRDDIRWSHRLNEWKNKREWGGKKGRTDGRKGQWIRISGFSFQNTFFITTAMVFLGSWWLWASACAVAIFTKAADWFLHCLLLLPPARHNMTITQGPSFGSLWKAFFLYVLSMFICFMPPQLSSYRLKVERYSCKNISNVGIFLHLFLSLYLQRKNKLNSWTGRSSISFLFCHWASPSACMFCISMWWYCGIVSSSLAGVPWMTSYLGCHLNSSIWGSADCFFHF